MKEEKEIMAVCPYTQCNKVIFRRATLITNATNESVLTLQTKCPHCGNLVRIKIGVLVETEPIY
jgi:hypothetical protein